MSFLLSTILANINNLSSDHSPIVLTPSSVLIQKTIIPKLSNKRTDWNIFAEKVNEINLRISLKTPAELETLPRIQKGFLGFLKPPYGNKSAYRKLHSESYQNRTHTDRAYSDVKHDSGER